MDSAIDNRCWNDVYARICALKTESSNRSTSIDPVLLFPSKKYRVVLRVKSTGNEVSLSLRLKYADDEKYVLAELGTCLIEECSEEEMQKNLLPLFSRLCIYAFLVVTHKDTVDFKIQESNKKISKDEMLLGLKIGREVYKQAFNILFYAVCHSRLIEQDDGIDHQKELKESTDKMLQVIGPSATESLMKYLASLRILSKGKSARMDHGLTISYSSTKVNSWLIQCYCSKMEGRICYPQMLQCILDLDNVVNIKEDCIEVELKIRYLRCKSLQLDSGRDPKKGRYFPAEIFLTMWPECDFGFFDLSLNESSPNPSTTVCKTQSAETGLQLQAGSGGPSLTLGWKSGQANSFIRTNENWRRSRYSREVKQATQGWILCNHSNGQRVLGTSSKKKNNYKAFKDLAQSDEVFTPDGGINFEGQMRGQPMTWRFDRNRTNLERKSWQWSVEVEVHLVGYGNKYMETTSQKFHEHVQLSLVKSVKHSSRQQPQLSLVKSVKHSSRPQPQLSSAQPVKHSSLQRPQLSLKDSSPQQVQSVKYSPPQQAQLSLVQPVKHSSPKQKSVKHSSAEPARLSLAQPVKHSAQQALSINASPPQLTSVQSNMGLDKRITHLENVYGWICSLKTKLNDGNTLRLEVLELSSGKKIALCAKLTGKHGSLSLWLETNGQRKPELNEKCSKKDMEKNLHPLFSRLCIYAFLRDTVKDIVDLKIQGSKKKIEETENLLQLKIESQVHEQAFNILFYIVCHFRLGHLIKQVNEIDHHKELKELTDKMLQVIGPVAAESLMKSLADLRIQPKEIGARMAGLKISYSSRLAIHCYCPCLEMSRKRLYMNNLESLEDALNHQLLQCKLRLVKDVNIEGNCIQVKLQIVNLSCKSLQLYPSKDQKRERHFPAMISVKMWPECDFEGNNLFMGKSSSNPSASVSKTQKNEMSFQGQLSSPVLLSLEDKGHRTTSSTSKNWRRKGYRSDAGQEKQEWTLYKNSNTEGQKVLDYKIYCNDHLRRAHKDFKSLTGVGSDESFTEDGGINFEGEEMCGPPMTWSFNRNLKRKSLKWSVEVEIWLAYFDNDCMETRYQKFGEQVELSLVQ